MSGHYERGCVLYDLKRYDDAIREFLLSTKDASRESDAFAKIAWCHISKKDWYASLRFAKQALAVNPENVVALDAKICGLVEIGNHVEARKLLNLLVRLRPERAYTHYLFAWFLTCMSCWKDALLKIDNALKLEPTNSVYLTERSRILLELGKNTEARQTLEASLYVRPEWSNSHLQRARLLLSEGNVPESIRAFRETLRQDPNDLDARDELLEACRSRFFLYRLDNDIPRVIKRNPAKVLLWTILIVVLPVLVLGYLLSFPEVLFWALITGFTLVLVIASLKMIFAPILDSLAYFEPEVWRLFSKLHCIAAIFLSVLLLVGLGALCLGGIMGRSSIGSFGGLSLLSFVFFSVFYPAKKV